MFLKCPDSCGTQGKNNKVLETKIGFLENTLLSLVQYYIIQWPGAIARSVAMLHENQGAL